MTWIEEALTYLSVSQSKQGHTNEHDVRSGLYCRWMGM